MKKIKRLIRYKMKVASKENLIRKALSGVVRIEPSIHQVKLSHFGFSSNKKIRAAVNASMHWSNADERKKAGMYRQTGYGKIRGCDITVNQWKIDGIGYAPFTLMSMKGYHPIALVALNSKIPRLKVRSAEYALDIFCVDPRAVSRLYYVFLRYCYFPRRTKPSTRGGKYHGWEVKRTINSVYYIFRKGKKRHLAVRIYERGPDEAKKRDNNGKSYWPIDSVDRVRVEYIFYGRYQPMNKLGLNHFSNFCIGPRFNDLMGDAIWFTGFRNSSKLVSRAYKYKPKSPDGVPESFQQLFVDSRGKVKNLFQYLELINILEEFKLKIREHMIYFDQDWADAVSEENWRRFLRYH